MIWNLSIETLGLMVALMAALIQICLAYFWRERPENLRRVWACILAVLVIAGVITNYIGTRQLQSEERDERIRIEHAADEREQQAQEERREISLKIQELVFLARERDPSLTEQEALRKITTEVRTLRARTSELEDELQGLRRYIKVAKYNVLGVTGTAGVGLKESSKISRALEGAFDEIETQTGSEYHPRCDDQGRAQFENVARNYPDFPFSYWALAKCLKQMGNPQWRVYAEHAISIFEHTTLISEHHPNHDQARGQMEALLAEQ